MLDGHLARVALAWPADGILVVHLLYCDETNLDQSQGDFLVYGGLIVSAERALALSLAVDEIRRRAGIDPDFELKFNPRPDNLSHMEFSALKQAVIETAIAHDSCLLIYLVLHDLATNADEARRFGINTICLHFNRLMERISGPGLVLIDRFNDEDNQIDAHMRQKFAVGIEFPNGRSTRLGNVVGFHYCARGQSHFSSITDIALGSFRFAINAHTRQDEARLRRAHQLLSALQPLFLRNYDQGPISYLSLCFRPQRVGNVLYRERYLSLRDFLSSAGLAPAQQIGGG